MSIVWRVGARYRGVDAARRRLQALLSFPITVEDLLRWFVADLNGMSALVDALDFSTLMRVHEQSVTVGAWALRRRSNEMVWRVS